jgi:hypothetical protein
VEDEAWRALRSDLEVLSRELLPRLLADPDPVGRRALWLRALVRAFAGPRDLRRARGEEGRLADLPLFERADADETWSARELVGAGAPLRWVEAGEAVRPGRYRGPVFRMTEAEVACLRPLLAFGRADPEERAGEAVPAAERRALAEVPVILSAGGGRARLLADLSAPGRVVLRRELGIEAEKEVSFPGLLVEVEATAEGARVTRDDARAIGAAYARLCREAAPALASSPEGCRALEALLPKVLGRSSSRWSTRSAAASAWCAAPLLRGPGGPVDLGLVARSIAEHGAVVVGGRDLGEDEPRVVAPGPSLAVLRALVPERRLFTEVDWRSGRERAREAHRAERRKQAEAALDGRLRRTAALLLDGTGREDLAATAARAAGRRGLQELEGVRDLAIEEPTGGATAVLAWAAVDGALAEAGERDLAVEVALRLGRLLAGAPLTAGEDGGEGEGEGG